MMRITSPVLAVTALLASPVLAGGPDWLDDHAKALERAEKAGRPIVVEFSKSDSSDACQALEQNVLGNSEFRKWSRQNAILLSIDFPENEILSGVVREQNEMLKQRFGVTRFPTVLVLTPQGHEAGRLGYKGESAAAWLKRLKPIAEAAGNADGWLTDHKVAMTLSKSTGRPVLVDFTGSDWCGWCIRLDQEVFDTAEFRRWAKQNVVLLKLDYPRRTPQPAALKEQNRRLARQYAVRGYPTILFLDHEGKVLGKYGYDRGGPEVWIRKAEGKMRR